MHATADAFTTIDTNSPVLAVVTGQTLSVGAPFNLTNLVMHGLPAGFYLFTLGPRAPYGLSVNPTNGVLKWTPSCHQGSTTNAVTVWVTDSGATNLSDAVTFQLLVRECLEPSLGTLILPVGQRARLPINLLASEELTNLTMTLDLPAGRLADPSVEVYESATNFVCSTALEPISPHASGPF